MLVAACKLRFLPVTTRHVNAMLGWPWALLFLNVFLQTHHGMIVQEGDEFMRMRQLLQEATDQATAAPPSEATMDPPPGSVRQSVRPHAPTPLGAPANITVVNTPQELQRALGNGAVDVEIRSHMDMRSLSLAANPLIRGVETAVNPKRLALLYSGNPLRSIRVC